MPKIIPTITKIESIGIRKKENFMPVKSKLQM